MRDLLTVDSHHFSDGEAVPGLVGHAPALREILARLPTLAKAEGAVLISGETGTGKAAREAGKERRDLGKLLKRHGLDPRWFASGTAAHPMAD